MGLKARVEIDLDKMSYYEGRVEELKHAFSELADLMQSVMGVHPGFYASIRNTQDRVVGHLVVVEE